jgi:hypothetical protein
MSWPGAVPCCRSGSTWGAAREGAGAERICDGRTGQEVNTSDFSGVAAAGPFLFVSSWLLMIIAGAVASDVGIRPFGYLTSMVVTIGLWPALAPAIGAVSRIRRQN